MQLKKSDVDTIFQKLGIESRSTGHKIGWFIHEGRKILMLRCSHGKGDVPGHVSDKIRSQVHLGMDDFRDLVKCPLKRDGYVAILRAKGIIE